MKQVTLEGTSRQDPVDGYKAGSMPKGGRFTRGGRNLRNFQAFVPDSRRKLSGNRGTLEHNTCKFYMEAM
jgi:hypothetical protein